MSKNATSLDQLTDVVEGGGVEARRQLSLIFP